ncbi:MAG: hypothetical protein KF889_18665 [Alphaproteobacteria bacterium]|nr:hypothetical protein [Alphaproteobacteria bacterium]MCW5743908.1 hypothetical protein [Alphaproteobacteria bacterium]
MPIYPDLDDLGVDGQAGESGSLDPEYKYVNVRRISLSEEGEDSLVADTPDGGTGEMQTRDSSTATLVADDPVLDPDAAGPSGTGKTLSANVLASATDAGSSDLTTDGVEQAGLTPADGPPTSAAPAGEIEIFNFHWGSATTASTDDGGFNGQLEISSFSFGAPPSGGGPHVKVLDGGDGRTSEPSSGFEDVIDWAYADTSVRVPVKFYIDAGNINDGLSSTLAGDVVQPGIPDSIMPESALLPWDYIL